MNVITKRLKVVIALVLFVLCGGIFLTTSLSASVIAQGEQDEGAVQDQEQDEGEIQDPEQQEQDEESEETEENNEQQELILYVSTGCPHCARVEEFIMNNDLEQEITIRNITVDEGAAEEYSDFVEENQIPMDEQGTPTLIYLDGEDFDLVVGDTPIEDFLSDKYDIKQESNTQGGDYLVLGFGLLFVSFILGYGIVKIINGAEKH